MLVYYRDILVQVDFFRQKRFKNCPKTAVEFCRQNIEEGIMIHEQAKWSRTRLPISPF